MQFFDLPGLKWKPCTMSFSPNGRFLAVWDYGEIKVFDTFKGTEHRSWTDCRTGMGSMSGIGFTADNRAVVAHHEWYPTISVRALDLDSGKTLQEIKTGRSSAGVASPGGRLVYLSDRKAGGRVKIVPWDPLTGERKRDFGRHYGYLRQLAISQDEQWVAGATTDEIRIWSLTGGKRPKRASHLIKVDLSGLDSQSFISGLALSHDGTYLAENGIGVKVWHIKSGEHWQVADQGGQFCREVAFHPDRAILAFSGAGEEVIFRDLEAQTEIKRYRWSEDSVRVIAFSPDGNRCAAATCEKLVIWDLDL